MRLGKTPSAVLLRDTPQKLPSSYRFLLAQHRPANGVETSILDFSMGEILYEGGHLGGDEFFPEIAELEVQQANDLSTIRFLEENNLIKSPPDRGIELALVVCGSNDEALATKLLDQR